MIPYLSHAHRLRECPDGVLILRQLLIFFGAFFPLSLQKKCFILLNIISSKSASFLSLKSPIISAAAIITSKIVNIIKLPDILNLQVKKEHLFYFANILYNIQKALSTKICSADRLEYQFWDIDI